MAEQKAIWELKQAKLKQVGSDLSLLHLCWDNPPFLSFLRVDAQVLSALDPKRMLPKDYPLLVIGKFHIKLR